MYCFRTRSDVRALPINFGGVFAPATLLSSQTSIASPPGICANRASTDGI